MISERSLVQVQDGPPLGGIAQLVEHLLCTQGVSGSNPLTSTTSFRVEFFGEDSILELGLKVVVIC